jgi:ADP-ribose pyrophosphatase YjhB (NUDIX family)
MKLLQKINEKSSEPQDYSIRKVVRSLILDETETKILFFGSMIVGGGVEEGESDEDALAREAMEEVGAHIEIIRLIGEVIAYRDYLKKKYIVHGYLCKIVGELEKPTTLDPEEQETKIVWIEIQTAIKKLEDEIQSLMTEVDPIKDDISQKRIYNRQISLAFLKEI